MAYRPEPLPGEPGALAVGGARVALYADGVPARWVVESVPLEDDQLHRNWGARIWRVTVDFQESCELRIR